MPPTYAEYLEAQSQLEQQVTVSFSRIQECGHKFLQSFPSKAGSYFGNCPRDTSGHCKPKDTGDETGRGQQEGKNPAGKPVPPSTGRGSAGNTPSGGGQGQGQGASSGSGQNTPKHPLTPQEARKIKADFNDFVDPQAAAAHGFEQGFVTSKGSAYLTKQGGTTRYKKSPGQGQGKIDPHSTATYYVTPDMTEKILEIMQEYALDPTYKASIRTVGKDQIGIVIKKRQTGQINNERSKLIPIASD